MAIMTVDNHRSPAGVRSLDNFGDPYVGIHGVDVSEDALAARASGLLSCLLLDRSTGKNIIWGTDHYEHLGNRYAADREITVDAITGANRLLIQPRVEKSKTQQWDRTKGRAEVFTPSWLCNEQNNRVDEMWFGRPDVFNQPEARSWMHRPESIVFEQEGRRSWKAYVDERRLEVAGGEAPYLVSRYDAATGESIALERRIGLLDRKLRVVTEKTHGVAEWRAWARRAVESIYGFEYQGDSLLLARENILATYADYARAAFGAAPAHSELQGIATVISWNIWQMDLLAGRPPLAGAPVRNQLNLVGGQSVRAARSCVIRDWRARRTHEYVDITGPKNQMSSDSAAS
jgi:hypothetical protein